MNRSLLALLATGLVACDISHVHSHTIPAADVCSALDAAGGLTCGPCPLEGDCNVIELATCLALSRPADACDLPQCAPACAVDSDGGAP